MMKQFFFRILPLFSWRDLHVVTSSRNPDNAICRKVRPRSCARQTKRFHLSEIDAAVLRLLHKTTFNSHLRGSVAVVAFFDDADKLLELVPILCGPWLGADSPATGTKIRSAPGAKNMDRVLIFEYFWNGSKRFGMSRRAQVPCKAALSPRWTVSHRPTKQKNRKMRMSFEIPFTLLEFVGGKSTFSYEFSRWPFNFVVSKSMFRCTFPANFTTCHKFQWIVLCTGKGSLRPKTDTLGNMLRCDKVLGVPHETRLRDDWNLQKWPRFNTSHRHRHRASSWTGANGCRRLLAVPEPKAAWIENVSTPRPSK